ncbi:MAG: ribose-phosphate pyrophosphokinase [Lentisphaerae bacterium]|jgi:ribose-phosphate pyrophosphokinase|nr:ribose-phosphate pyrophosphokinase [Lentisphaerota bacterium]
MLGEIIVVGAVADDPLANDIAHYMQQETEISDILAYKRFANTEFCPRFISDENDLEHIGHSLDGKTIILVSSCSGEYTRNARAMRSFLVACAAKDNGARKVILVEPDLFYSAQDRGPLPDEITDDDTLDDDDDGHEKVRSIQDYKKFDGQPFSARLYANLLKASGVDAVMTVHNHSANVRRVFRKVFNRQFYNLCPASIYANYLAHHAGICQQNPEHGLVICAPDKGAAPFAREVFKCLEHETTGLLYRARPSLLLMDKERSGERKVSIVTDPCSPTRLEDLVGRDVVVCDDMVRTGGTIAECCRHLKNAGVAKVIFVVTHFYSSQEVKENLHTDIIDDIITTNTLPNILNRDMQGRLRHKMLVLKIERWIVNALRHYFLNDSSEPYAPPYTVDVSRKNPRWKISQQLIGDL